MLWFALLLLLIHSCVYFTASCVTLQVLVGAIGVRLQSSHGRRLCLRYILRALFVLCNASELQQGCIGTRASSFLDEVGHLNITFINALLT